MSRPQLRDADHQLLDRFLAHVLDEYKAGSLNRNSAVGKIAHLVAAVDRGAGVGDNPRLYMTTILDGRD